MYLNCAPDAAWKLSAAQVWGMQGIALGGLVLSWVVLLVYMDMKFLNTFYSTMTGKLDVAHMFKRAKNDEQRVFLLGYHPDFYMAFEDELETLIKAKWDGWKSDPPRWLTEQVISTIPDHMLPVTALFELRTEGGGERRRSVVSIRNSLGFGVGAAVVAPDHPSPV